ncbi:MAG: TolC family protein, partial [Psychromonas sp.]|nr:TolC family protein [Psychromonas sp.]
MKIKLTTIAATIALTFSLNAGADTLLEVYEVAKIKDPTILISYATYQSSLENISESRASLLPQINFEMKAGYTQGLQLSKASPSVSSKEEKDLNNTNGMAKLGLTQSLYNGTYWQDADIAERTATEYKANYGYNAQKLIMRTAEAYFSVLRADEAVKSVAANKRAVERQLEQ